MSEQVQEPKTDIKKMIVDHFKAEGLDIAEEAAVALVKSAFKLIPAIALATENKIDDMFVPALGIIEPKVIELLDGIDGEDDPNR